MKKKENKKIWQKKQLKIDKLTLYSFFIALPFMLVSGRQYSTTIIDFKIPTFILLVSGLGFGVLTKRYFFRYLTYQSIYGHIFWSTWTVGSLVLMFFFLLNSYTASKYSNTTKTEILKTRGRYRGGFYVTVRPSYFEKDLFFSANKENIDTSRFVILQINKGGLGFDIIKNKWLVKN